MTPVILMTAQASLQSAISAVNSGCLLLHPEAVLQRRAGRDPAAGLRVPRGAGGEQAAQAGDPPPGQGRRHPSYRQVEAVHGAAQAGRARGADRLHRPDPGRERHRQGGRRPLHPQPLQPGRRTIPLHQLRRATREPAGERAVRAREGLVHRRGTRQAGALRGGAGAGASSSTRSARCRPRCRSSCSACSRSGRRSRSAPPRRSRWTSGSSPRPTGISRRRSGGGTSGPTCSTASMSSRSTCRRSASAGTTCSF